MIGKGAQYLTAAGFGRYRITAASLGRNLMFWDWLLYATKQAIMDAFGVDGTAVIRATNEYLNGIAASDNAKATALAAKLNYYIPIYVPEDKDIIYSLVPIGYIRSLNTDGNAYLQLRMPYNTHDTYELLFEPTATGGWAFGGNVGSAGSGYGLSMNQWRNGNQYVAYSGNTMGSFHEIVADKNGITIDGNTFNLPNQSNRSSSDNIRLYWGNGSSAAKYGKYAKFILYSELGEKLYELYPFIRNNVNGMIDILTDTFFANAGSGAFTITKTPPTP